MYHDFGSFAKTMVGMMNLIEEVKENKKEDNSNALPGEYGSDTNPIVVEAVTIENELKVLDCIHMDGGVCYGIEGFGEGCMGHEKCEKYIPNKSAESLSWQIIRILEESGYSYRLFKEDNNLWRALLVKAGNSITSEARLRVEDAIYDIIKEYHKCK